MVQVHLGPPTKYDSGQKWKPVGGVAQLGEHLPCKQGVASSNLAVSTNTLDLENLTEETKKSPGILMRHTRQIKTLRIVQVRGSTRLTTEIILMVYRGSKRSADEEDADYERFAS